MIGLDYENALLCVIFKPRRMLLKVGKSNTKERCPFCNHDDLWRLKETRMGTKYYVCKCGYRWRKETMADILMKRGYYWSGKKYTKDNLEEQYDTERLD